MPSTPSESYKPQQQQQPGEPIIPGRFFEPVSAEPEDLEKYAPDGKVVKTLGSKICSGGQETVEQTGEEGTLNREFILLAVKIQ